MTERTCFSICWLEENASISRILTWLRDVYNNCPPLCGSRALFIWSTNIYSILIIYCPINSRHYFSYKPRIVEEIAFFDYKFSKLDCPLSIYIILLFLFLWKTLTKTIYSIHCSISWLETHNCYKKKLFRKYKGE